MKILIDVKTLEKEKTGKAFLSESLISGIAKNKNLEKHDFYLFSPKKFEMEFQIPKNFHWIECGSRGIKYQLKLIKEIWSKKYDLFLSPTSFIPVAFGRGKMIPIFHDFISWMNDGFKKNRKAEIIEKLLAKIVVKKSLKIITNSDSTTRDFTKMFPKYTEKAFKILGCAKEYKNPTADEIVLKKYNLKKKNFLFFVSTLEPRKNLPNTFRAFKKFLDFLSFEKPDMIKNLPKFVIAGKKGWFFDEIFKTIDELKLHENVQFLGYIPNEDLPALFKNSCFLLHVPFFEGFGLPVIESISFGTPCVTSNTSSLPEALGECGIAINPKNVEEIFEAIKKMWCDENFRKSCEEKTYAWSKNFTTDAMGKRFEELLENLKF